MQSEYELCGHSDLEKEMLNAAMACCPAWHQPESIAKIIILWLLGEGLLCARLCVWVHSHKGHVIPSVCYYLVFRKETEARTSCDVAFQGHRTWKWPRNGWHLYLSASRPFHYTLFPRGWKTLQQSSCEITVRSICAEPGTSPHCSSNQVLPAWLSPTRGGMELVYISKEAIKLPFLKPAGSRRPELSCEV